MMEVDYTIEFTPAEFYRCQLLNEDIKELWKIIKENTVHSPEIMGKITAQRRLIFVEFEDLGWLKPVIDGGLNNLFLKHDFLDLARYFRGILKLHQYYSSQERKTKFGESITYDSVRNLSISLEWFMKDMPMAPMDYTQFEWVALCEWVHKKSQFTGTGIIINSWQDKLLIITIECEDGVNFYLTKGELSE